MEKICFEVENCTMQFLDKKVLEIDRLTVHQFDRIGIVGKNGAGKSTLLTLLAGMNKPSSGTIQCHVEAAYFAQIDPPTTETADPKLIGKLGVPQQSQSLSGGEQTKLKIAQLFTDYYEALLIDEPTTHLDKEGITFLREQLAYYYGALIIISHDRALLDELVTTIWEIEDGKVTVYAGNYSDYEAQKALEVHQQAEAHAQYIKEKKRLEKAVEKKKVQAQRVTRDGAKVKEKPNRMFETKSKGTTEKAMQRAAKAMEQRIEQLDVVEAPNVHHQLHFRQSSVLEMHNKFPIMADQCTVYAGDKILLKDVRFQFPLENVIAITGKNGSGKSTLLQHIVTEGKGLTVSPKVVFGVYNQLAYQFQTDETVYAFIAKRSDERESVIRAVLHAMQFTGTDLQKSVRDLSGGETIRLLLCQLFLGEYNVLILDEPTNFLDVFCIEALEDFIHAYKGTIILVSHDERFIDRVADHVYVIEDQTLSLEQRI